MRCHEVRKFWGPYLDSELDARTSFEIEQHLEACPDCARVFDAEKELDERIFATLRAGEKTNKLWAGIETEVAAPRLAQRLVHFARTRKRAVFALLAVGLGVLAFALWPRERTLDLAVAVAHDHTKYVTGAMQPQFDALPSLELLNQTSGRLDAAAFAKLPAAPDFRSQGKRLCHLSGVPVAWTLARVGQLPVSVVVLRRAELDRFPQVQERLQAGHAVVCSRSGRFQFAARVVGEHVVCAIAATSRERLEDLVRTVPGAG
jgi:anti-sigma factor RsiW